MLCILSGCGETKESNFIDALERNESNALAAEEEKLIDDNLNVAEQRGEDAYDNISDAGKHQLDSVLAATEQPVDKSGGGFEGFIKKVYAAVYKFFAAVRMLAVPIILISEIVGFIGAKLSTKNKAAKKFFIITCCIGIPVLVICAIYGYGYLTSIFYYKNRRFD